MEFWSAYSQFDHLESRVGFWLEGSSHHQLGLLGCLRIARDAVVQRDEAKVRRDWCNDEESAYCRLSNDTGGRVRKTRSEAVEDSITLEGVGNISEGNDAEGDRPKETSTHIG